MNLVTGLNGGAVLLGVGLGNKGQVWVEVVSLDVEMERGLGRNESRCRELKEEEVVAVD